MFPITKYLIESHIFCYYVFIFYIAWQRLIVMLSTIKLLWICTSYFIKQKENMTRHVGIDVKKEENKIIYPLLFECYSINNIAKGKKDLVHNIAEMIIHLSLGSCPFPFLYIYIYI